MNTISFPYRPPGYLERQGYVKPAWEVVLRRSDTKRTYVPDDEAYNLPAVKAQLESDKYSVSTIDHVSLELTRTDELVDFLEGLAESKRLSIKVFTYLIFRKWENQLVRYGRLENLPEGIDAYPWDKLKLTFVSAPGAWEDGDEVKDPDTETWYKNKHVKDLLLPRFLKKGFQQAGPGGGCNYKLDEPKVKGPNYFWSSLELPRKKLARPGATYDDTYQVKRLCWDSSRKVLYMGVWSSFSAENPWLMSYHPASRRWDKVCGFTYAGHKDFLKGKGWEVLHLEYSAAKDKVYYVCETTVTDLAKKEAHYKCFGEINIANPPADVALLDANLFTLHNKGVVIKSQAVRYKNKGPVQEKPGATKYWAYAAARGIGWGTPRGEKEHGVLGFADRIEASLLVGTSIEKHKKKLFIARSPDKWKHPGIGYSVEVYDVAGSKRQSLGRITHIEEHQYSFECTVEEPAAHNYPGSSEIYLYPPHTEPTDNVFIAKPQNVKLRFHFPAGLKSIDSATVYVEARDAPRGRDDFYWPRELGELDETGELYVDRVGYVSFIEFREMEMYDSRYPQEEGDAEEYYSSGPVARFEIELEGYNPSFLVEDGFLVASALPDHGPSGPLYQAGRCRVIKNGVTCKVDADDLATYGDIFLFKDASGIWAAWNGHDRCYVSGESFSQCRIAKWNEARKKFEEQFCDRKGERWFDKPECYITSFGRYKGRCYGGRRYFDPNWVPTNLRIFWAAPPQQEYKPTGYDSLFVGLAMVTGDRTDLFEAGTFIQLGDKFNQPTGRHYYVSEVQTGSRELQWNGIYLSPDWREITDTATGDFRGQVTWMGLLSLDAEKVRWKGYAVQAMDELGDKYINFMKGRIERHQIWRW